MLFLHLCNPFKLLNGNKSVLKIYMKNVIRNLLAIVIISTGAVYIYFNREQLIILKDIKKEDIVILVLLNFIFLYATGYTFKLLIRTMNINLSFIETIGLSVLTNFANYLGPIRPGAALKAVYLKHTKGFLYANFASVLVASSFLGIFMRGACGLIILLLLKQHAIETPAFLYVICIFLTILPIIPFLYKIPRIKKTNSKISKIFHSTIDGLEVIQSKKNDLIFISSTFIVQFFLSACITVITFNSLGVQLTFLTALFIGIFTSIANLLTITPSNLGIQEIVSAYIFTIAGFDFTTGIIGASIGRIINIIVIFSLSPIFSYYLLKNNELNWKIISQH